MKSSVICTGNKENSSCYNLKYQAVIVLVVFKNACNLLFVTDL